MGSFRTKDDDVAKSYTSVFITNFPESCSANELFQSCKQYDHVVDTFIPTKRSKNGRRFGFVRFINVFKEERLRNSRSYSKTNVSIGHGFSQLKQATMEFTNEGRIAWVEVEGIPFKLWTDNTFKRIATKWGELLDIDDQEEMYGYLWRDSEWGGGPGNNNLRRVKRKENKLDEEQRIKAGKEFGGSI
ncbi:nucleotide-binding alpha-beta plait domain-containing protein [Tanacetum coccineum]